MDEMYTLFHGQGYGDMTRMARASSKCAELTDPRVFIFCKFPSNLDWHPGHRPSSNVPHGTDARLQFIAKLVLALDLDHRDDRRKLSLFRLCHAALRERSKGLTAFQEIHREILEQLSEV